MVKATQIGNNLNIILDGDKVTINLKTTPDFDLDKFYKLAFKYNQDSSITAKNLLSKMLFKSNKTVDTKKVKAKKLKNEVKVLKKDLLKEKQLLTDALQGQITFKEEVYKFNDFLLPKEFVDIVVNSKDGKENIEAYISFIKKLAQNPISHVRNNFWEYMKHNKLKLTPSGNILAYRYVIGKFDVERAKLISTAYFKIRQNKKSPRNYFLNTEGVPVKFDINDSDLDSTLSIEEEYKNLDIVFTDAYTGLESYKVNSIINKPWEEVDTSTKLCSKGYHFTNLTGLDKIAGYGHDFGNQLVLGIINPALICAIPGDNYPKFRAVEWYFAAIIDREFIGDLENSDISVFDIDYETKQELSLRTDKPFEENKKNKVKEIKNMIKEKQKEFYTNKSKELEVFTNTLSVI